MTYYTCTLWIAVLPRTHASIHLGECVLAARRPGKNIVTLLAASNLQPSLTGTTFAIGGCKV
ncbi:hypothetical protein PF005_g20721 [Phytophthora fragariae]|uniref:Uncharacterized protein n=2 Tax=Phytophthora TaxID=4783 RepID=A0A6A3J2G8_9STRA|nr:hypothetical protein PF003_g2136 [Phytophthora fragariae]KAE8963055.1 hypothetical protein PR002_g29405 [Phytophthora rubi]KAE8928100.1 hypothetical protein PF009_g21743 [Phytophthora fragariae]KAE8966632.1 hypothetical protein PR001_g28341 [Phytophthora rubi]KAE8988107.1 hypothetical protein PF011_g19295 [Phytophthora fragariae]